jgi:hypothetical protein
VEASRIDFMRKRLDVHRSLASDLADLKSGHVLRLRLARLEDLVSEPEDDPRRPLSGPQQAGVVDLATTLTAARHLPDDLTVEVELSPNAMSELTPAQAQAALNRRASYLASTSWRESMAVRNMGLRQLPLGIVFYVLAAAVAAGFAYLAQQAGGNAAVALFTVLAALAMTIAWVVSWMVVESTIFDWRPAAHETAAYELLARATVEVLVEDSRVTVPSP